jgi:hypothetical protein
MLKLTSRPKNCKHYIFYDSDLIGYGLTVSTPPLLTKQLPTYNSLFVSPPLPLAQLAERTAPLLDQPVQESKALSRITGPVCGAGAPLTKAAIARVVAKLRACMLKSIVISRRETVFDKRMMELEALME